MQERVVVAFVASIPQIRVIETRAYEAEKQKIIAVPQRSDVPNHRSKFEGERALARMRE